ncbi:fungal specific transcription factor factor [Fusarium denticulatum]|uniref:Fungal specific transcription factor factor n=1 Tax=Fusarium denticulatum TaxID=48507 RepID=A0A8H5UHC3_9HYPO|nr:fungal specific transcription factor factor [Fusarium denticulatum]
MYIMLHISHLLMSPASTNDGDPPAEEDVQYQLHSRRKCIQAALQNVELLIIMETESRPSGAQTMLRNKMSILAVHEALVATAVLSTFLYHFGTWPATTGKTDGVMDRVVARRQKGCGIARPGVPEAGWEHGDGAGKRVLAGLG